MPHMSHYNPLQPRVPRGYPHGGRWTDDDFTPLHQAFLPAAPLIAEAGAATAAVAGRVATAKTIEAALTLLASLSVWNSEQYQAILAFKARDYRRDELDERRWAEVGLLTKEEVKKICDRFLQVRAITDAAVSVVRSEKPRPTGHVFGSRVHKIVRDVIHGPNDDPLDENFRAEVSILKTKEEAYGTPGSIRVDVIENVGNGTVCVYDVKTGSSILKPERMAEIVRKVFDLYGPKAKRIVVAEVGVARPLRLRWSPFK
jgi:hypothetical protein